MTYPRSHIQSVMNLNLNLTIFPKTDFPLQLTISCGGGVQKEKHGTYKNSLSAATAFKKEKKNKTPPKKQCVTTKSVQLDVFLPCYEWALSTFILATGSTLTWLNADQTLLSKCLLLSCVHSALLLHKYLPNLTKSILPIPVAQVT